MSTLRSFRYTSGPFGQNSGRSVARKRTRSNPFQKSSDMLTKSIKEVLWRTVLANGCFCFHIMKLPMPDGLSAASFNHSAWLQARRSPDPPTPRPLWLPG